LKSAKELGARDLFPGGVNSPVRAYGAVGGDPPVPVRGEGAYVIDSQGRRYIDYVGAFGPLILGHAQKDVVAAVEDAVRAGGPFGLTVDLEVRLARLIKAAMPAVEKMRFTSSGTEAAMSALRLARAATGRDLVLKFDGGYHGHADSLLVKAGSGVATLGLPGSAGVTPATAAQTLVAPYNDLDAVANIVEKHGKRLAAVIVEPVAANMGVVPPAPGFLEGLRMLTAAAGALLVFDEVITGFRVAHGGAQALFGVSPDLTVLGKIIGGGLPVGAFGGRADLLDLLAPQGPVYQAGTLSGHPAAMAAGCATLEQLDEALYERLEARSQRLAAGLAEALPKTSVARVGSLLTVFCRGRPPIDMAQAAECDSQRFARLFRGFFDRGVLLPPSQFEAWFVSDAHHEEELEATLEAAGSLAPL
jgi:glutamate-1-semialdehyde 2,1-aminomutase